MGKDGGRVRCDSSVGEFGGKVQWESSVGKFGGNARLESSVGQFGGKVRWQSSDTQCTTHNTQHTSYIDNLSIYLYSAILLLGNT